MATDAQLDFARRVGALFARELDFPPFAGRILGYLAVSQPQVQTIAELSDALLASRSAANQEVAMLEDRGLVRREPGEAGRPDSVRIAFEQLHVERILDASTYRGRADVLRSGVALLGGEESPRRAFLDEQVEMSDFLADAMPGLLREWQRRHPGSPGGATRVRRAPAPQWVVTPSSRPTP